MNWKSVPFSFAPALLLPVPCYLQSPCNPPPTAPQVPLYYTVAELIARLPPNVSLSSRFFQYLWDAEPPAHPLAGPLCATPAAACCLHPHPRPALPNPLSTSVIDAASILSAFCSSCFPAAAVCAIPPRMPACCLVWTTRSDHCGCQFCFSAVSNELKTVSN